MLEFNVGELTTRLRRALGVRGRMPLGLDEHTIAAVITADVTTPPWRSNPVFCQGASSHVVATGGNRATLALGWQDSPLNLSSVFVMTGYALQPVNTVIASGAAVAVNEAYGYWSPGAGLLTGGRTLITTERTGSPPDAIAPYRVPLALKTGSVLGGLTGGEQVALVRSGTVQPPVWTDCQTVLRPGDQFVFSSTTAGDGTNQSSLIVTVRGLFFGLG